MFGYIVVHKPELKMKDFYQYKAYYCGLCKTLKKKYGRFGQMTLSYDMTFLILLLTSVYESKVIHEQNRCITHPVKKQNQLLSEMTEYVADMNIALTYHHLLDDWEDERSVSGLAGAKMLEHQYHKIEKQYQRQCDGIKKNLKKLQELEQRNETNIDLVAGCFGDLMGEIFVYQQDMWEDSLRGVGFYLGKFIYILDAYDDVKKDKKKKSYNPFIKRSEEKEFHEYCGQLLNMMISQCCNKFEKLPCLMEANILRNILYEGVWTKYDKIQDESLKRKEQGNDYESVQGT